MSNSTTVTATKRACTYIYAHEVGWRKLSGRILLDTLTEHSYPTWVVRLVLYDMYKVVLI
jgi:hypothetical protein